MTDHGLSMKSGGRSFRHCVQDCACDERMVGAFDELYGTQLRAPILTLLRHKEGDPCLNPYTEEGALLARFILFVYDTVWPRETCAATQDLVDQGHRRPVNWWRWMAALSLGLLLRSMLSTAPLNASSR